MKTKRNVIIIFLIIIILVIALLLFMKYNKKSNIEENDGVKTNISEKLKETKKLDNLNVTNIQITEVNGETKITANIENTTGSIVEEFPFQIKLYDKSGDVIKELGGYAGTMQIGEVRMINANITMEIDLIHDISFAKNK